MSQIRNYLRDLTNAPTAEALWDQHCSKMAEYGFDRILYGFSHFMSATSMGDPEDFIILTNHDRSYMDWFIGEGHFKHAPMVRWALANEGACSWSYLWNEMARGTLTDAEKQIVAFNQSHHITAGYSISFKAMTSRSKGAVALTARKGISQQEIDAVWADHGEDIILMNNVAHLKLLTLPYKFAGRALTKRQREVLEWVGDGKTMQDTAMLMGLTTGTIEKHLRLARESLSVETTAQAVLKASFQNQVFVVDPL